MKKLTAEEFINKSNKKHNHKYTYSKLNYQNNKIKVTIICPIHGEFQQRPSDHINGQGCPECKKKTIGDLWRNDINIIIDKCKNVHNNKYDYSLIKKYNNTDTKVKIICPKHGEFNQTLHNHLNGQGCPKCKFEKLASSKRHSQEQFLERCFKKFKNENYDYSLVEYKNDKKKVDIICSKHGIFKKTPNELILYSNGCPKCTVSIGETKIINFLIKNHITYEHQKTFNDCKYFKKLRFDFFIPEKNTIIEFDGEQHYKPIKVFGGIDGLRKNLIKDKIKNEYCKNKNINLIRIPFTQLNDIEKILTQTLLWTNLRNMPPDTWVLTV